MSCSRANLTFTIKNIRILYMFLTVKYPGHGVDHPPSSVVEVKEKVELYLCSVFGPSWPVLG
jgi:hypothetical protein